MCSSAWAGGKSSRNCAILRDCSTKRGSVFAFFAPLQEKVLHFRRDFTTDYTDYTDGKRKRKCGKQDLFIRVIRVIRGSILWLRLCRSVFFAFFAVKSPFRILQSAEAKRNHGWTRMNTDGKTFSLSAFIRGSNPQFAIRNPQSSHGSNLPCYRAFKAARVRSQISSGAPIAGTFTSRPRRS